jgi:hypothetical protein
MELLKEEEEKNLRDFAIKNGFNVQDLFSNSNNKKELNDIYEEAANFKITKVSLIKYKIILVYVGISRLTRNIRQRKIF